MRPGSWVMRRYVDYELYPCRKRLLQVKSSHRERTKNKKHSKTRFILVSGFRRFIQNNYNYKVLAKIFLGYMFCVCKVKGRLTQSIFTTV